MRSTQAIRNPVPETGRLALVPGSLPAAFSIDGQDGAGSAEVLLRQERVVIRRGQGTVVTVPIATYRGVSLRLFATEGGAGYVAVISLVHAEDQLSFALFTSTDADAVGGAWLAWGSALGLPLLALDEHGDFRELHNAPRPKGRSPRRRARTAARGAAPRSAHAR